MTTTTLIFLSAWFLLMVLTATIETQAWTTTTITPLTTRSLYHARTASTSTSTSTSTTTTTTTTTTALFGKKKKKDSNTAKGGAAKMQVKLLQHIAGTGQAGDVILVNPIFFDNKLRPQKLARVITDEEVKKDLDEKQCKSEELQAEAKAIKDMLDDDDDDSSSSFVLTFTDNQTGPDGKKLFGGIGPKKLMEALGKDSKAFDAYSKKFTKQVSIIDIEEEEQQEEVEESSSTTYKDYSTSSPEDDDKETVVTYSSLPKKDKLTIKHTGIFRMKVSLTKELFANIRIVVD